MSGILGGLVVGILLAIALLLLAYLNISPIYMVMGDSMYPTLLPYDIVFAIPRAILTDPLKEGDIIIYRLGDKLIIHRIIKVVEGEGYIVKGDNNPAPDPILVRDNMVVAKVIEVSGYPAKVHIIPGLSLLIGVDLILKRKK